jgi:hypothetical protein
MLPESDNPLPHFIAFLTDTDEPRVKKLHKLIAEPNVANDLTDNDEPMKVSSCTEILHVEDILKVPKML